MTEKTTHSDYKVRLPWFGLPRLVPFLKPYKGIVICMAVLVLLNGVIDICLPLFQQYAINNFIAKGTLQGLGGFIGLYVCVIALQIVFSMIDAYQACQIEMYVGRDLKRASFNHLQTLSFSYFNQNSVGYIHARVMSDTNRIGSIVAWGLMDTVWNLSYLVGVIVVMFVINWRLALWVVALTPVITLIAAFFQSKLTVLNRRVREINSQITGNFNEGITGAKTTKTLVVEEKMEQDFGRTTEDMRKTSIRKRDVEIYFRKAKGYKYGDVRWTQDEWDAMRANAGLKSFPNTAMYGITVRNADLREMPSHTPRFSEPTPDPRINPFDYFQYSLLPVGTPVFIAHTSRDGNWYYVETPVAAGWVDANDIGIVDEAFEASYKTGSYVAVLRDNVPLPGSLAGQVNIGTVLPLAPSQSDNTRLAVLVPVKNGSRANVVTLTLAHEDAAIKPLPMTPAQVALIGNVMMGQRYGWGGMFGDRDCSALTRELLTPFGIWLPRNSLSQARSGRRIMLDGMSIKEKEKAILRDGVPFLTLVWLRGHIMLYVGPYKGRPAIFHNVWGVRTVEGASDNERFVIGRAVVSSITPGSELRNLYRTTTFGDRVNSITVLGGR